MLLAIAFMIALSVGINTHLNRFCAHKKATRKGKNRGVYSIKTTKWIKMEENCKKIQLPFISGQKKYFRAK